MGIHADDAIDSALDDWVNEHDNERDDYDDVIIKHSESVAIMNKRAMAMSNAHKEGYGTPSSNGRTVDFGSTNRGSNPCGVTIDFKIKINHKWGDGAWEDTLAPDIASWELNRFFFFANLFDLDDYIPFDSEDW